MLKSVKLCWLISGAVVVLSTALDYTLANEAELSNAISRHPGARHETVANSGRQKSAEAGKFLRQMNCVVFMC